MMPFFRAVCLHNSVIIVIFAMINRYNMSEKIRIKDIAERAGVSVGTVDRVLHGRPNVSPSAKAKVDAVLKELDYKANVYASALARNRSYRFILLMPEYESEAYWEEIKLGAVKANDARRDFHISLEIVYFDRFSSESYVKQCRYCLSARPDGLIIVPMDEETTRAFTDSLHSMDIPFVLLDSFIPDLKPLAFFGQDSFCSGYFAAKMLMLIAREEKEVMLMRLLKDGRAVSRQQENRAVGFMSYMQKRFPNVRVSYLDLPIEHRNDHELYTAMIDSFFALHPDIHHCITFNSKAYIVADYLLATHRKDVQIMGYDMVNRNAMCLREGTISFLIAQHAFMQGSLCVETLFQSVVLHKEVTTVNYMPIELITRENMDFYQRSL